MIKETSKTQSRTFLGNVFSCVLMCGGWFQNLEERRGPIYKYDIFDICNVFCKETYFMGKCGGMFSNIKPSL